MTSKKIAKQFIAGMSIFLLACTVSGAENRTVLETVATLEYAPGNIAVTEDGTVIVSLHGSMAPPNVALEVGDGEAEPFPEGAWSTILREENSGEPGLRPVLGVRAGRDGILWMLSGSGGQQVKHIYGWSLQAGKLVRDIALADSPAVAKGSFFNDLALAPSHDSIFISDPAAGDNAAIVVIDLVTGTGKRKLEGHPSVRAEEITAYIGGKALGSIGPDGATVPLRGSINPITIDSAEEWVYYGAMSGQAVYRVRVADLLDDSLSLEVLGTRVERYADKPISAGITIDDAGNVYVTDIQANGVGVAAPGQAFRLLVQDEVLLSWPDGISVDSDGYVYVASNSLFRTFGSHSDGGKPEAPFYITRFRALGQTTSGR